MYYFLCPCTQMTQDAGPTESFFKTAPNFYSVSSHRERDVLSVYQPFGKKIYVG